MTETILKSTKIEKSALYYAGELIEEKSNNDFEDRLKGEKQKAYLKGREEGEMLGYDKAHKELGALFPLMRSITQKLLEKRESLVFELKREIVEFAIAISEKILRSELSSKEKFAKVIGSYLSHCSASFQKEVVKISLAPEDLVMLEMYFDEIHYDKSKIIEVMFFPDTLLQRGDFRIETKTALLNCTLMRELDDLRSKVLQP